MATKRNIIVGLAVGLLAFGAAITWAGEFNALREYSLLKFSAEEADDWDQTLRPNGSAVYECTDSAGCEVVVLNVGVDDGGHGYPTPVVHIHGE